MLPIQLHKRVVRCTLGAAILALPSLVCARDFTPTYTLTDLGVLPGSSESISVELNDHGCAIGIAIGPNDKGVLFQKGKVIDVDPSAVASSASGINSESQVTGYFYNGAKWDGFIYGQGKFTVLQAPGSIGTYPESLNDIGQTAGSYVDAAFNDHIFVRQPNGSFQDLGSTFGIDPSALAINDQGRVLIGAYDPQVHTYISRPGSASLEEVPSLIPNGPVSPGDMNEWGMVVGWAAIDASNQRQHAYVYFEGKIKDLGVLPGGDTTLGNGINNFGQTVGSAYQFPKPILDSKGNIIGYTPEIDHGWVSLNGTTLLDLNGLLNTAATGWEIIDARSINDRGEILADAVFQGVQGTRSVLLRPNVFLP